MQELYITQYGPTVGNEQYTAITTESEKSCATTNLDGTVHTWPRKNRWLVLTEDAQKVWLGYTEEKNGFVYGLLH